MFWFSQPSSKTDHHYIAEILLNVALNTKIPLLYMFSPLKRRLLLKNGLCFFILNYHYVIKFVSDLRQVGGFLWVLRFPPPIKLTVMI
jgi:hypothetical protein